MNYGNILTTTWKTLWRNKAIIGFGMLMMIPPAFVGLFVGVLFAFTSEARMNAFFESDLGGLTALVFVLVYFLVIGLTLLTSALSFSGSLKGMLIAQNSTIPLSFSELWEASLPFMWRMLGVMFSIGFVLMLLYMVPVLLISVVGAVTAGLGFICLFPLLLLLIPFGAISYMVFSLSMAALVAEDGGVFSSIQRGWDVMKSKFWPLVLMTVILYFIQMGIGMVIAIPINIFQFALILPMQSGNVDPDQIFRFMGILFAIFLPLSSLLQGLGLTYVNGAWMLSYLEVTAETPAPPTEEDEIVDYAA